MDGDESGVLCLSFMRHTVHIHAVNDTVTAVRDNLMTAVKKKYFFVFSLQLQSKNKYAYKEYGTTAEGHAKVHVPMGPQADNIRADREKQVCADSSFHSAHLEEEDTSNSGCFFRGKLTHPEFE